MKTILHLAIAAALMPLCSAFAGPPPPKHAGIESKDYQWAKMEGEMKAALEAKGVKMPERL